MFGQGFLCFLCLVVVQEMRSVVKVKGIGDSFDSEEFD